MHSSSKRGSGVIVVCVVVEKKLSTSLTAAPNPLLPPLRRISLVRLSMPVGGIGSRSLLTVVDVFSPINRAGTAPPDDSAMLIKLSPEAPFPSMDKTRSIMEHPSQLTVYLIAESCTLPIPALHPAKNSKP